MNRTMYGVLALGLLLTASPAEAQERWTLEVRPGAAFPTGDAGELALDTGYGFEGTLSYRFVPHLSGYAGWDWYRFGSDETAGGPERDFEETGYVFGLRFEHPFSGEIGDGPDYRIRAGGTYSHLEIEGQDGESIADSGHGLGWEARVGVSLPLGERWRLSPGARYRALSRDLVLDGVRQEVELEYVAAELGVGWSF